MSKKHEDKNIKKEESEDFKNLENQLKKALADYQNLEKRIAEEKSSWIKTANKQLLLKLLPAVDSLMLAEKHTKDEGVAMSIKQLLVAFENEGVNRIEVLGKNFDPQTMECVHTVSGEDGKVVEEIKPGYKLHDTVLRVAQVAVGKESN
jgi:molecular chaperone GrpE